MNRTWIDAVAVGAIAGATIGFELLQTKVLSALYYNHAVYVTVAIALMGFGISGVVVALLGTRLLDRARRLAALCAAALAVSMFASLGIASHVPDWLGGLPPSAKLMISYAILVVPFLFAGSSIGLLFMANGARIHTLYMVDLVLSAAFVLAFCLLLEPLGAAGFAWACIGTALAASLLLGGAAGLRWTALAPPTALALGAAVLAPTSFIGLWPEPYKTTAELFSRGADPVATRWTMTAKIDVWPYGTDTRRLGHDAEGRPADMMITQDNDAHTNMLGPRMREEIFAAARRGDAFEPVAAAYLLRPQPEHTLVIGVGGGKDVVTARAYGSRRITGAELNPATVDLVSGPFRNYAAWPDWPEIDVVAAEGRHFVRTGEREAYDVIMMSGVDTFAALSSGAYVLSENYLYTVEAMHDYLGALRPGGVLAFYRWFFETPRESLRLVNLYLEAAAEQGIANPEQSVIVVAAGGWAATFVKKDQPFTAEETAIVAEQARRHGWTIIYAPGMQAADAGGEDRFATAREAFDALLEPGADRREVARSYVFNITPVRDDRPFFFEYHRAGGLEGVDEAWLKGGTGAGDELTALRSSAVHSVLYLLLGLSAVLGGLAMLVPLFVFSRQGLQVENGAPLAGVFASLGLGFMLVEVGLMQRLALYLGHPMYSVAVVLAGMLLFAGIGAYMAQLLRMGLTAKIGLGMLGSAALTGIWLALAPYLLDATAGWTLTGRVLVCLASLAPVGIVMGIPFATCLRYLHDRHPAFIPWAWGINGITSVLASVAAVAIAMQTGFTLVVAVGAAVYVFGFVAFILHRRPWGAARIAAQPAE
jgi:spermidine synthase